MACIREAALRTAFPFQSSFLPSVRISPHSLAAGQIRQATVSTYICRSCRAFSSQAWKNQQAAARAPETQQNADSEKPTQLDANDVNQLNEALDQSNPFGIAAKHSHHFKSRHANQEQRAQTTPPPSHLQNPSPVAAQPPPPTPSLFREYSKPSSSISDRTSKTQRDSFRGMMFPDVGITGRRSYLDMNEKPPEPDQSVYEAMHLTSRTGKTLAVDSKSPTDLAVKLGKLEMLVARNKVRQDMFKQRFHERPGLRRKRLKSERWRRRFKNSFVQTVARVQELRRKGW